MKKANMEIRTEAKKAKVCLWQIADALEIGEATLMKHLRYELPAEKKAEIRAIIKELREGK